MKNKKSKKILWSIKTSKTLQLWPEQDKETSLTRPWLPKEYVNTKELPHIKSPKNFKPDFLNIVGIRNAAFTEHSTKFFCERVNKDFPSIMFTISGLAEVKTSTQKFLLHPGTVFLSATNSQSILSVKKNWNVLWFHLKNNDRISNFPTNKIIVKKSIFFDEIINLAHIYKKEVYSNVPDTISLEHLAYAISNYIQREFSEQKTSNNLNKIKNQKSATQAATILGITKYELNKITKQQFGTTFAKKQKSQAMQKARKLLAENKLPVFVIAQEVGYSSVQAFAKAFKKFHKVSASEYKKQLK